MTLITPDLIEKAAEAIELAMWNEPSSEALARAALRAVIPDVVEKCAQAAWLSCWQEAGTNDFYRGHRLGCEEQAGRCAEAVRSLIPQEGK